MIKNIYTVRDNVSQELVGGLIMEPSDPPAMRAFYDALRTKNSLLAEHPADFDLLKIGTIDTTTGELEADNVLTIATGNGWLEIQKGLAQ
ncbi:MAG: nonstructural protein [Microvirus sp.]|nr:MAG: nonstructural protein [Microvirus sp.]